jgi:signal transduction histidine kinase
VLTACVFVLFLGTAAHAVSADLSAYRPGVRVQSPIGTPPGSLGILVPPTFWPMIWSVVLAAAAIAAVVWILWRIRTRMLRARTEQLQAEVSERTEELRRANERLREANATRERLFSIIAHDLRSPVTGMSVLMSRAVRDFSSFTPVQLEELIGIAATSVRGIESMLDNLLEWSQLQLGAIELAPQKLAIDEVVPPVIDAFRGAAYGKEIRLIHEAAPGLEVLADPHSLKTILANLVSNAVKFTETGGAITISSEPRESDGEHRTTVTVRDTGVGIPESELAGLFDPGTAGRTLGTAGERGSGLGLGLCRELVERLGGSISIVSTVGVGTTVTIDLPA